MVRIRSQDKNQGQGSLSTSLLCTSGPLPLCSARPLGLAGLPRRVKSLIPGCCTGLLQRCRPRKTSWRPLFYKELKARPGKFQTHVQQPKVLPHVGSAHQPESLTQTAPHLLTGFLDLAPPSITPQSSSVSRSMITSPDWESRNRRFLSLNPIWDE